MNWRQLWNLAQIGVHFNALPGLRRKTPLFLQAEARAPRLRLASSDSSFCILLSPGLLGISNATFSDAIMAAVCRPHSFVIIFRHRQRGLLVGWLKVSCQPGGQWQTQWDIGTIDRDPRLSDDWFCRDEYDERFRQLLQAAADKCVQFELPGATSRWGRAMGMPHRNAVELAHQVQALWQEILLAWEAGGCVGEETKS